MGVHHYADYGERPQSPRIRMQLLLDYGAWLAASLNLGGMKLT
jgi:hypothetical protein